MAVLSVLLLSPAVAAEPRGAPIIVLVDRTAHDPFRLFLPEMLRTEGLNAFQVAEVSALSDELLATASAVILRRVSLSRDQAALLEAWVRRGGLLVGIRPPAELARLFGVVPGGDTIEEGWIRIDTSSPIGSGLEARSMRLHSATDLVQLQGARSVAALLVDAKTPTAYPAVTVYRLGAGTTVLFCFDLAKSVVRMRQGNEAWAGYPNDHDGFDTMRASQMFMDLQTGTFWNDVGNGAAGGDHRNDIPQADMKMRLLTNALIRETAARLPLPRIWYFPDHKRALLVMSSDHHGADEDVVAEELKVFEAHGGRLGLYLWRPFDTIGPARVAEWLGVGHEMGVHFDDTHEVAYAPHGSFVGQAAEALETLGWRRLAQRVPGARLVSGGRVTWEGMRATVSGGVRDFGEVYPDAPLPRTTRMHYLIWASTGPEGRPDPIAQARILAEFGIEMDTTITAFPKRWGYMTGSGLPMKFLDTRTGEIVNVYEQATHFEDDIQLGDKGYSLGWDFETAIGHYQRALRDANQRYHTAVTMLFHPVVFYREHAEAVAAFASANDIPIWSPLQWLEFWKAREAMTIETLDFGEGVLRFRVSDTVDGATLLVPNQSGARTVREVFVDGRLIPHRVEWLAGLCSAGVAILAGDHDVRVVYDADRSAPLAHTGPVPKTASPASGSRPAQSSSGPCPDSNWSGL